MLQEKEIIAGIAIALTFIGYIPYVINVIKGKTQPHIFSWFLWSFVAIIAFALQVSNGAGAGAYTTLGAGIVCFIIFLLSLKNGKKHIAKSDIVFFVTGLIATFIWVFAEQPLLSTLLLSSIDMLGFAPTVRKSWHKPYSETLVSYQINVVRFGLVILAIAEYNALTVIYPAVWLIANGLFCIMLIMRRQTIGKGRLARA